MLNVDYFYVLSALLDLGEHREAKKVAARILAMADIPELWTIAVCAEILDSSNKLAVGKAKLDRFAHELNDEHRAALVQFCRDETGTRPRRTLTEPAYPLFGLSVHYDTRPGYDQRDAQPAGLVVHPDEHEQRRQLRQANTMAGLTRDLRTTKRQLPPHVRTQLRATSETRPECRRPPRSYSERRAAQVIAEYAATRLNVEDHTTQGWSTIFDVDDDKHRRLIAPRVMAARIAEVRAEIKARTAATEALAEAVAFTTATDQAPARDKQDTPTGRNAEIHDPNDGPDVIVPGYEFDYDKAAQHPLRTTPCVWCFLERRPQDAPHNRHDDGLCGECREANRPGIPERRTAARQAARTVAYLNPAARAHAARAAAITAQCAAVAAFLPPAAALVWIRAHYRLTPAEQRPTIEQWVSDRFGTPEPQPPTTPAPAAPIQHTPALAAA